ncbi:MAG: hypothetical protein JO330_00160 [Mycobacteriaceae bacterium]|nr:hypothetical protein [Mycobacteriaceae bacterium]
MSLRIGVDRGELPRARQVGISTADIGLIADSRDVAQALPAALEAHGGLR